MKHRPALRTWVIGGGALGAVTAVVIAAAVAQVGDAPRLDPELDVAQPVLTGASGEQTAPRADWNGREYLVTWRSSFWKDELRATRVSAAGKVLDGRGVRIAGRERNAGSAAVASVGGGGSLIAFVEEPATVVARFAGGEAEGPLTLSDPLTLWAGGTDLAASEPAAAAAGSTGWVVWGRQGAMARVSAARVSLVDKRLLDAEPITLGSGPGPVAAAVEGTGAWAVWATPAAAGQLEVRAAALDAAGAVTPVGGTLLRSITGASIGAVAVAAGASGRLAAAAVTAAGGFESVHLIPFDTAGRSLSADLSLFVGGRLQGAPALAAVPGGFIVYLSVLRSGATMPALRAFLVAPQASADTVVRELGVPAGTLAGQHPTLVQGHAEAPLVIWEEVVRRTSGGDLADSDILAGLAPLDAITLLDPPPTVVALAPHAHSEPVVAWNGRTALVVFEDARRDKAGMDIYAARLDAMGRPLDGSGLGLGTEQALPQRAPVVAWDGQNFVVAWHQGSSGLGLVRVTESGMVDPVVQRVTGTERLSMLSEPAICATGGGTLLMWAARASDTPTDTELRALRIPAGQPSGFNNSFVVAKTADTAAPVLRLGCDQAAALLIWSGKRTAGGEEASTLNLGRLLADGQTFDVNPGVLSLAPRTTEEWAGIASDGRGGFLAAWRSFNDLGQRTVFAARIDAQGKLLDRPFISVGQSNSGRRVTTLWDGQQWVVMAVNTEGGNPFELRGRRLTPAGQVVDPTWFRVATLSKPWGGGGAGAEGVVVAPGRALLVYEQYPEDDASSNPRARARYITTPLRLPGAPPPAEDGGVTGDGPAADRAGDAAPISEAGVTPTGVRGAGGGCDCTLTGDRAGPDPTPASLIMILGAAVAIGERIRRRRSRPRR